MNLLLKIFDPFAFAVLMFVRPFCDAALTSGGDVLSRHGGAATRARRQGNAIMMTAIKFWTTQ